MYDTAECEQCGNVELCLITLWPPSCLCGDCNRLNAECEEYHREYLVDLGGE